MEPIIDVLRDFGPADDADRRELALQVHEAREAAVVRLSKTMPDRYLHAAATHPDVVAWVRAVARASTKRGDHRPPVVERGPSLLLQGRVGTGKTHQAWGAIRALAVSGLKVAWSATTAADLYARMRPRHGVDAEVVFEEYAQARLLLLDDLGAAKPSEWTEEVSYRLVNYRYENRLPTLVTTNVGKDLTERLGERVVSRLREMASLVVLDGADRRQGPTSPAPLPFEVEPFPEVEGVPMPDEVRAQIAQIVGRNRVPAAGRAPADPNQRAAFVAAARSQLDKVSVAELPEEENL
jgi:DNA replication protein DnaC